MEEIRTDEEIEIEVVTPEYAVNKNYKPMYRFNKSGKRFYYDMIDGEIKLFPSVTTTKGEMMPFSTHVLKYLIKREGGVDEYDDFMDAAQCYGTALHICMSHYLKSGGTRKERSIHKDTIRDIVYQLCEKERIPSHEYKYWTHMIRKDMTCLKHFLRDYDFEPLYIEYPGYYSKGDVRFAGAIDLIGYMTIEEKIKKEVPSGEFYQKDTKSGAKKGDPKMVTVTEIVKKKMLAIVDWKSGKKGFYKDQAVQLKMYAMIVKQHLGLEAECLYNVTPNETSTNYKLKERSEDVSDAKLEAMLNTFFMDYKETETVPAFSTGDVINDDTEFITINIKDYLKEKMAIKQNLKLVA